MFSVKRFATMCTALLTGCALMGACSNSSSSGSTDDPLKVGFASDFTGPFSVYGQDAKAGAEIAVKQINADGGVNGRKLEVVYKDTTSTGEGMVRQLRALASERINIISGMIATPSCTAADPVAKQSNLVVFATACSSRDLTGKKFGPNRFNVAVNTAMLANAAAAYAVKHPEIKTWNGISADYEAGHSYWDGFGSALKQKKSSANVGVSLFSPIGTKQWAPKIQTMQRSVPSSATGQGLFSFLLPNDWASLVKEAKAYNFFDGFDSILAPGAYDVLFKQLGAQAPKMTSVYDYFHGSFQNSSNQAFVAAYQKQQGDASAFPNAVVYQGYMSVQAMKAAVIAAGSTDTEAILKALPGKSFDGPAGKVSFREDHQLVAPVSVFQCEGDGSQKEGYACTPEDVIPADSVMPPVELP
jgi:branched-chain amino acid transport system substrate-binding protein